MVLFLALLALQQRTDTLVVRAADVPASAVRRLAVEWQTTDATADVGDIREVAVAPDGRVYIWDPPTPAIWILDANGKTARKIGRKGGGPGEYGRLNGLVVRPDGKVVTWDGEYSRLSVYAPDGASLDTWRILMSGNTYTSSGLTATVDNRTMMRFGVRPPNATSSVPAIIVYTPEGSPRDTLYVPKFAGDAPLTARGTDGSSMSNRLPYGTSARSAMSPLGHVVSGPGRPYVFHTTWQGRPVRVERQFTPVSVSSDERRALRARLEANMRNMQPNWTWTGPDIPPTKPAYDGFLIGQEGRIWVQLSVESERFTPDPPRTAEANPLPAVPYRAKEVQWDVFEPDGRFVARVAGPRTFTAYVAKGDAVWGVIRDENDLPQAVKMKFTR